MRRPDRIVRSLVRYRFLVTMDDGQAWDGTLMEADDRSVVLRDAALLTADGAEVRRTTADGEVVIPRDRIAYMQRPGD